VSGVEGWNQIVRGGEIVVKPSVNLAPRTALGVDATRLVLFLVVADGRQSGYSEGVSFHELAAVMRDLGCMEAAGMDGGGSTIMALSGADGQLTIMNRPSDRILGVSLVRPLPMLLTLQPRPVPPGTADAP